MLNALEELLSGLDDYEDMSDSTKNEIKNIIKENIKYQDSFVSKEDEEDYEWMPREDLKDVAKRASEKIWRIGEEALEEVYAEYHNRQKLIESPY